jgi:hypothetical protein
MKNIGILLLSIIVLIAIKSCSIEDDEVSSDSIQGTWKLIAIAEGGLVVTLDTCELEETIVFLQNTGTIKESINDVAPCTFINVPFSSSFNGNAINLMIAEPTGSVTYQLIIDQLTETNLSVRFVGDSEVGSYNDVDIISQTFVRQ